MKRLYTQYYSTNTMNSQKQLSHYIESFIHKYVRIIFEEIQLSFAQQMGRIDRLKTLLILRVLIMKCRFKKY